jgi:hypothetical protein
VVDLALFTTCVKIAVGTAIALPKIMTDIKATIEFLKLTAAAQVAKYPQYDGHFVGYRLARVTRNVRTKMGPAFTKGEFVIATERTMFPGMSDDWTVTAWSRKNAVDTSLKASDVEWLS